MLKHDGWKVQVAVQKCVSINDDTEHLEVNKSYIKLAFNF